MDFDELLKRSAAVSNAKYKDEYVRIGDIETVRDFYSFNVLVSNLIADFLLSHCDSDKKKEKLHAFLKALEKDCDTSFKEWVDNALESGLTNDNLDFLAYTYLCSNLVRHFETVSLEKLGDMPVCFVNFNVDAKSTRPEKVAKNLFAVLDHLYRDAGNLEVYCKFVFDDIVHAIPLLKSEFLEMKAKMSMYEVAGLDT